MAQEKTVEEIIAEKRIECKEMYEWQNTQLVKPNSPDYYLASYVTDNHRRWAFRMMWWTGSLWYRKRPVADLVGADNPPSYWLLVPNIEHQEGD